MFTERIPLSVWAFDVVSLGCAVREVFLLLDAGFPVAVRSLALVAGAWTSVPAPGDSAALGFQER